ncbi:MAG TPA: hypothetical protein VF121_13475 [Thermoanaerobaculia bacterium]|nr:hypothetical protein [Thermoanaerobaculia bacterium]
MMGRALLVVGWMATLGFAGSAAVGYLLPRVEEGMRLHVLLGLASSLLLLFSHCWIMFYLIGTGRAIKDAVRTSGLPPELYERTKDFKNRSYPALMLALGLAMATFILGGGVYTGAVPLWVHHALFYATLAAQLWALRLEARVLAENDRLMGDINRRLAARPAAGARA